MTGSVPDGVTALGLMLMGLIALGWAGHAPMQAAALMAGIVGLSALPAKSMITMFLIAITLYLTRAMHHFRS